MNAAQLHNFRVNLKEGSVSIDVKPSISPIPIVMHAAYHFIDDAWIVVGGEPQTAITVTLSPINTEAKTPKRALEKLGYQFNVQLISSFLEDLEGRRYAGVRNAIVQAALNSGLAIGHNQQQRQ